MAVTVNVAGLATIKLAVAAGTPLNTLGYTQNGAQITFEGYQENVPGDENGGDAGPPVDVQYLGQTARVRLELTKFDTTIAQSILARLPAGTLGSPVATTTPGILLFASSQFFRLLIHSVTSPYNFPCATFVQPPHEINIGTRFSRYVVEALCYKHPTSGVLFNSTTT